MLFPALSAYRDWGLLTLRVAVGIIFVVHGWAKLPGLMTVGQADGGGGSMALFFGIQGIFETVGGLALIFGVGARLVALLFAVIMVGAIIVKHTMFPTPFMASTTTGWEFDFVLLAANIALLLAGPGALALYPRARQASAVQSNPHAARR